MTVDKTYCMSSFLMYRTIADDSKCFKEGLVPRLFTLNPSPAYVKNSAELEMRLRESVERICAGSNAAIALSGGIDSAILARFMPKGSVAYTFKCVVPGMNVTDETPAAARYAAECGLEHRVVEIYWEDFEKYAPGLMIRKGLPIHSIEVQIYKAALKAKEEGIDALIFGESCDVHYGGLDKLLSKDWKFGEFVDRYLFVKPYCALREFVLPTEPIKQCEADGGVNVFEFLRGFAHREGMGSYANACEMAGVKFEAPYADTRLAGELDLARIRSGESKYLVRELFKKLYPRFDAPQKTPMPRPMNEWMEKWDGPKRAEFWPHCTDGMTGDQKWLVWALEKFLNLLDSGE